MPLRGPWRMLVNAALYGIRKMAEAWYTFPAQMGQHRAFLTFDNGFAEIADTDSRKFLFKVRVAIKFPNEAGMPTNDEFPALVALDEALDHAVTSKGGIYVGRVTVNAHRHFFFYVDFDEQTADDIASEISNSSNYQLDLAFEEDPNKDGYWNDLYPTRDDWQVIRDLDVLDALSKHGDNAEVERQIQHWAYFQAPDPAERFADWLKERGYFLHETSNQDDGNIKVTFSHVGMTTLEALTKHTISINRNVK
jgi:hypothetical protein